jgi:hypothetical protein
MSDTRESQMRKFVIINIAFSLLWIATLCLFNLAVFGGLGPTDIQLVIIGIIFFALFPVGAGTIILLIYDVIKVFKLWKTYKMRALIPLCILFGSCFFIAPTLGAFARNQGEKRFISLLAEYDSAVKDFKTGRVKIPESGRIFDVPQEYKHLAYLIAIDGNEPNNLTVSFLVGRCIPPRHVAFIYVSSDNADEPHLTKEWKRIRPIKEHWFRASD